MLFSKVCCAFAGIRSQLVSERARPTLCISESPKIVLSMLRTLFRFVFQAFSSSILWFTFPLCALNVSRVFFHRSSCTTFLKGTMGVGVTFFSFNDACRVMCAFVCICCCRGAADRVLASNTKDVRTRGDGGHDNDRVKLARKVNGGQTDRRRECTTT